MGKITKNYIYNLIYQVFVLIIPLVTAPYLARTLGPHGTGVYGYINSVTSLVCTFVMLGIYNYGNRKVAYVRDNKSNLTRAFWEIIGARIIISVIGTAVYVVVIFLLNKYTIYFTIYYLYLLAYFIDCTWLYVGIEEMKWAVIKNAITKIIAVVGIFVLVKSEQDLWLYILIQGSSVLISNAIAYRQIKLFIDIRTPIFKSVVRDLKGAFILFLPSVANTVYLQCDKIMIEAITGGTSQVAFYDYSEKIVTIPLTFITVVSTVMMPRIANEFAKGNKTEMSRLLNKAAKFSVFLAFPMMFGLIAIAHKLVPWYLGNDFMSTSVAICIIAPIVVANSLAGVSGGQYFTATNQIGILTKAQIGAAVGNIIINAILIPKYGFIGAAIATVISSLFCATYQYYCLVKQIRLPGLLISCIKYFVSSLVMYIIIYVISKNMEATYVTTIIQVLIGTTIYIGIQLLLKDEQVHYVIGTLKKKIVGR